MISQDMIEQVEIIQVLEKKCADLRKSLGEAQITVMKAKDAETIIFNMILDNEKVLEKEKNKFHKMMTEN